MQKLFVADDDFVKEFGRSRAKGHKRLIIDENVEVAGNPVELMTNGTDLVVKPAENAEGAEVYTILCKEFGLVGGALGFRNKVSVIFLDEGWMLVTLLHGALVLNLQDQLMMPMAGDDFAQPKVVKDDICWVNADNLLEYGKYLGEKGKFIFDFEWLFTLGGDYINGLRSFYLHEETEETLDISLGYYAQYEQQVLRRAEAKKASKLANNLLTGGSSSFDFDDEEDEDDDENYESDDSEDDDIYGF